MTRYRFAGYEIDVDSREIRRNGHRLPVQPQPFLVLTRLLKSPGQVVSRDELIEAVWGETNLANASHSLNIAVRKLRDALDETPEDPRFVETVAKVGYRFIGRLESAAPEPKAEVLVPPLPEVRPAERRRVWLLAGAGAAAALLVAWNGLPPRATPSLLAPGEPPSSTHLRLLWDNAADVGGRVSADGRYFSYTDWRSSDIGISVRDLVRGVNRKLTRMPPWSQTQAESGGSAVSPDGKFVAFALHRYPPRRADRTSSLEVISMDGSGQRTVLEGRTIRYVEPYSWSPDGYQIAAGVVFHSADTEGRDALALVNVSHGETRVIPTPEDRWPGSAFFSPDGRWLAYSIASASGSPGLYVVSTEDSVSPPRSISGDATLMGWTPDGRGLVFTRPRDSSRDLYFQPMRDGLASGNPVLLHTAMDIGPLSAGITTDGTLIYSTLNRRAEAILIPASQIGNPAAEPLLRLPATAEVPWRLGPGAAHLSPDGSRFLVVTPSVSLAVGEVRSGVHRTITPQLKRWRAARWTHDGAALLLLGMDPTGRTGIFRVNDTTGEAALLAAVPTDTWSFTPSRDGQTLFHGTPVKTQAVDLTTRKSRTLFESSDGGNYDLRVSRDGRTLAIRGGLYLAVTDLATGKTRVLYRRPEPSAILLWAMEWSADGQEILSIVRPGGGLEKMELWTFPAQGGQPKREPIPASLRCLSFSPDGRFLLTTRGEERWQVWGLANFLPGRLPGDTTAE